VPVLLGDELLSKVAKSLATLRWKTVYLGGSTTHLHLTDAHAPQPELTDDVDVVVDVSSPVEFQVQLREALRALGAKEDTSEDAPTCRWLLNGLKVDVMSPNADVLDFSNRWYPLAIATAGEHQLPDGTVIRLIHGPVFLATKLEAYRGRGTDCLSSKDVEDIIALLDGRPELAQELSLMPVDLGTFVAQALTELRQELNFGYAVEGYLHEHPERAPDVHARIDNIITACQKGSAKEA